MGFKKAILVLLLLIILTMGAASAADTISEDISDADDTPLEITDNDFYTTGESSFSDLADEIENTGMSLDLNQNYAFNNETDDNSGIVIGKDNFVLNGNGRTIDGNNQSRLFNIIANNVTLNDLILINGNYGMCGGIRAEGTITLNNVTFINNYANEQGGAIGVTPGTTIICNNTKFIDNYADSGSSILVSSSEVKLYNSYITSKNFAKSSQIYLSNAELYIENTTFTNITASYAPAIYGKTFKALIRNSKFLDLKANITAGAIGTKEGGELYIENCEFKNITSSRNGGVIFADVIGAPGATGNVTIIDSKFRDTYSEFGGAYVQLGGDFVLKNTEFINSHAKYNGGAIYLSYTNTEIDNCTFDSNGVSIIEGYPAYGGAIFCDISTLNITDSKFFNNVAIAGSAIYAYDNSYNIKNSIFENNVNPIYTVFDKESVLENNVYVNDDNVSTNNTNYATIMIGQGMQLILLNNTINITTIPDSFDLRDYGWVSSVKNQGGMGACWTFGMTGSLESALLKAANITTDFSENNMQNTMIKYSIYGCSETGELAFNVISTAYLLSWLGAFTQNADTYDEVGKISPVITTLNDIHVQDVMFTPNNEIPNGTQLKLAIMKYGSIDVSFFGQATIDEVNPYYNPETHAHYVNEPLTPSHDVSIIGWNDSYDASNFLIRPPGNGAWIVKNSYGTEWGENGFFYISYYDKTLIKSIDVTTYATSIMVENTEPYNKNYQYNIIWMGDFKTGTKNVSYMSEFEALDDDAIAAVGTYFDKEGNDYTVKIYVNDELKLTQTGVSPYFGYRTIKLNKYIPVRKGDVFKAVITSKTAPTINLTNTRTHYTQNLSFISFDGEPMKDTYDLGYIVCLKVYTVADSNKTNATNTFTELESLINASGQYLTLDDDYEFNNETDNSGGIVINKDNFVLNGNGHTIDGKNQSRMFNITANNVTIKNILFKNGHSIENVGVVYFNSTGTITNCNFVDNKATGDYSEGGAVFFNGEGKLTNCNFTNNFAKMTGGAVYFSSNGTVSNCNFTNNTATYDGGAVYFDGEGNVTNCNFTNNTATDDGGAVYFQNVGTVSNCNFTNNQATNSGGALVFSAKCIVTHCNFANNTASYGGAVYMDAGYYDYGIVENCNFTNNQATNSGGALVFSAKCIVTHCNFANNTAPYWGGAIYSNNDVNITNCDFANNKAKYGGVIYSRSSDNVKFRNCNFTNNLATINGGAINFEYSGTLINCNFINNTALNGEGGAVIFYRNSDEKGNVINCNFTNNTALSGSAIIFDRIGDVTNCNFVNNQATGDSYGGAIKFNRDGTVVNSNFTDNSASRDGGAIYFAAETTGRTINCNFTNNQAISDYSNGGAIYFSNSGIVENCNFINNTAYYGGAIYFDILGNVTNCTFSGNSDPEIYSNNHTSFTDLADLINSASPGDVLELDKDYQNDGSISSSGITISKAITIDGKGHTLDAKRLSRIFEITSADVTLKNIIFRNGFISGQNYGGAIHNNFNGNILNCSFVNCSAHSGGAVAGYGDQSNFSDCSFVNCSSSDHSGAVDWSADCNVFNCIFINCSARYGGAFACGWIGDNSIIYNCTFINCSSSSTVDSGGAIWFIGSNLCNIFHCTFINCLSKGEGGGVYFYGEGNISDCSFVNCSAKYGGAIYFNRQSNGYNCNFINCSAELGKAIYASDNTLISNCNFETQGSESLSELVVGGIISNCTINGNKEKTATNMTIITEDITYGENATITVTMTTDGTVTVNINNQNIGLEITNGTGQITIPNLNVGEYIVKASFEGNSDYESANATTTLTVTKIQSMLTIQPIPETTQGENINIIINVQNDATGTITLTVNGENYIKNIENGQATFNITGLDAGNYEAIANYAGDTNYLAFQNSTQFTVKSSMKTFEDITNIISNAHAGDTINLEGTYYGTGSTITVNKELTIKGNGESILDAKNLSGILSVSANNVRINNIRFVNGKINANGGAINWIGKNGTISNCTFINCSAENGGSVYWNAENGMINTSTFDKSTATSNGGAIYWNANNGEIANSIFTNSYAQNGGAVYVPENRNVEIKSSIFDNNMAEEESGAVYGGTVDDDCTFKNNTYTPLNTTTIISINETAAYSGNEISITTLILSQKGGLVNTGTVEIYINSKLIATIPANTAYIYKTGDVGTYRVLAKFIDDSSYKNSSSTAEFTVIPVDIPEEIETSTAGIFTLEFPDDAEGTLTVFIDGTKYKVYDIIGGILKIDLSDKKGKYNITFEYSGDKNYPAFKKDANITVETNPSITASNAKVLYSAGTTYKITVYKNKGITANSVSVVIKQNNKKLKPIKTNSKGIASFKVTQTPGTYKLKITSLGKTVTKTLTVKHIVTLKTATVKKSAKKLILQATLTKVNKKYLKKKTVTFKFNGKTYKTKTNAKGVAKVTIKSNILKKLKVGKKINYQATYLKDTVKKTVKIKK